MTPVTYVVVATLKKTEQEDYYDRETDFNPFIIKYLEPWGIKKRHNLPTWKVVSLLFLKNTRSCRVLQSSEPAKAVGLLPGNSALAKPIASLSRDRIPFYGCWLRTEVQHRVHSRARRLYHKVKSNE